MTSDPPIERPAGLPAAGNARFGSDVAAETLRALDIPFIALNPGASFRGLHDSLVNHLGNKRPRMLLCLHEEHAVAIAHGWAKVTGRPMAAAVHSNVGLMHASMAVFNAWCDRAPVLLLGATGPVDAAKRRPWIDWIHTAADQGALVRPFVKWDAQPASAEAAREALLRAAWLARTPPMGPVYVNLDAGMQEAPLTEALPPLDPARFLPETDAAVPPPVALERAAALLRGARAPLILMGRCGRGEADWARRIALAERLGAQVVTDLKLAAAFPTDHPRHVGAPATFPTAAAAVAIAAADVILSLDWVDLAGTLKAATGGAAPTGRVIHASLDHVLHNGWSMDHQGLPPVDVFLAAGTDTVVAGLLELLGGAAPAAAASAAAPATPAAEDGPIAVPWMARTLRAAIGTRPASLLHVSLSWQAEAWPFRHPLDYLGADGGAGIGAGPGIAVGAALALRGSRRLAVAVCGDGDFLMGVTALWTAVHYGVPLLVVVANNRSFFNDELHQERVARARNRPVENRWIGQRIAEPEIDLASLAAAQGARGFGPVTEAAALTSVLAEAIAAVEAGAVAVVDVRVAPGYGPATSGGAFRG